MSERGEWSQHDEEPSPRCAHCRRPLDSEHESLCEHCRVLADAMPGLVVCEGCDGACLERTNSADTLADYAVWCRTAGKGVDPLDTYPLIALGLCMPCVRAQMRDREDDTMINWDGRETVGRGARREVCWPNVIAACIAMLWPVGLVWVWTRW